MGGQVSNGKGGDIIFQPGRGGRYPGEPPGLDGAILFQDAEGVEFLRLETDGRAFVRGELIATNEDVFKVFAGWVVGSLAMVGAGGSVSRDE